MTVDRRAFLLSLGAAGLPLPASGAAPRVRRSLVGLRRNDTDLEALRVAIPKLRASGAWQRQVALHADMRWRHHASWRFLPWHRLQLVWFERLVARASGKDDFALPYWDWDNDTLPELFWTDRPFELAGREARRHETITGFLRRNGQDFTGRLTDDFPTFFGRARQQGEKPDEDGRYFSGSCEWSGHNLIHGFVGGDMGRLDRSPNDPAFWMHHANIDRLWTLWAERQGRPSYSPQWKAEVLQGFVDHEGRAVPPLTAGDTVETGAFGYRYDQDPSPPNVMAAPPPPRIQRQKDYAWAMTRLGPNRGVIEIREGVAGAWRAKATGFIEVVPDAYAPSIVRLRALTGDGQEVFRDAIFQAPMGHAMGAQGYRIDLSRVWGVANAKTLRLEAETGPVIGRRSGEVPPRLQSFVVDVRAGYAD